MLFLASRYQFMNFEDFIIPPPQIKSEKWQLGNQITQAIPESGIALLFVSDFRGANREAESQNFRPLRKILYRLSKLDFEVPIADLGDLVSGKTLQDTHYILQEVISSCLYKNTIPIIIGGSNDLAYSLFSTVNFHQKNTIYTHISDKISLSGEGEEISEKNFLNKIFSTKNFSIQNFHLLGYQKHLNEVDSVKLLSEVEFDIIRLAEMMNATNRMEPFFRKADLVSVNCDAVESFSDEFSINPQVNGLNKREICAYMKEIGLGENLKSVGIFNFNFESENRLNYQLLAQMIWYLIEGINIQKSHPKEKNFETFYVMIGEENYTFRREIFRNLWYFGNQEDEESWIPCSQEDFELAKKRSLNYRLLK